MSRFSTTSMRQPSVAAISAQAAEPNSPCSSPPNAANKIPRRSGTVRSNSATFAVVPGHVLEVVQELLDRIREVQRLLVHDHELFLDPKGVRGARETVLHAGIVSGGSPGITPVNEDTEER